MPALCKADPDGKFQPDKTVTRAELAVALAAMIEYIRESRKPILPAKSGKTAAPPRTSRKQPAQAISFLKKGGYLPKDSPIIKGGNQRITTDELADALSSITTRLIELDIPAKSDVD